ncbi:IPT/TIG domain-containing protein [Mucilaginibacter aquariorum]|uniref:IPT/TIG domain-containing protein n=1 Tax=Mucilaginibacter aquariorum TaxID=2967225 RepID=A0ABT1T1G4_9SPHI|nr:IPT/TIG domain-containing protein [Mucilaginibacter aquariorum]MCQ6958443.1 IPT/TIG domain-containing protein [Mucilaginibacter aquariorum]
MKFPLKLFILTIALIVSNIFFTGCSKRKDAPEPVTPIIPVVPVTPVQDEVTITSLNINEGHYNETVLINGTGFNAVAEKNKVFFNNKEAAITAATTTQLTVTVPSSAGTGTVKVTNGKKSATGPSFTYNYTLVKFVWAGSGAYGATNGYGLSASFNVPTGLAANSLGDIFVADQDNNLIRKITKEGIVSTFAGNGTKGSKDGTGTAASFNYPSAIAIDKNGNLFVAENGGYVIRKITPDGVVTTIAGSGIKGNVNASGKLAQFNSLNGIAVTANGDLYVCDTGNNAIRKITATGEVTTYFQGNGITSSPHAIAIDDQNNIYVADPYRVVLKIDNAGTISKFNNPDNLADFSPQGITIDKKGDKYILNSDGKIFKLSSAGIITAVTALPNKTVNNKTVNSLKPQATAVIIRPAITADNQGNFYISDLRYNQIIKASLQ